jgi:hypothetical protein
MFISSRESINVVKLNEFDESLLQRYTNPGAPNVIILLLIADSPNDPCIAHFNRQINLINEYVLRDKSNRVDRTFRE